MQSAREEAEELLSHDPTLETYPLLHDRVRRMFENSGDEAFN